MIGWKTMSEETIHKIASDLGIIHYSEGLSRKKLEEITIFSAASLWLKNSTSDVSFGFETGSHKHIIHLVNSFIDKMCTLYPNAHSWFYGGYYEKTSPAQKLLDILLKTGELNQTGLDPNNLRISLPPEKHYKLNEDYQIERGVATLRPDSFVSSVSIIAPICENSIELPTIDNSSWVTDYVGNIDNLAEELTELPYTCFYYHPSNQLRDSFRNSKPLYKDEYCLIRDDGGFEKKYYLSIENKLYVLPKSLISHGDIQRFKIYLSSKYKEKTVYFFKKDKMFQMTLYMPLPRYEYSQIVSVMWPIENIDDGLVFIGPFIVKDFVENIIMKLGMRIKWST